jgi:hypothetical protein
MQSCFFAEATIWSKLCTPNWHPSSGFVNTLDVDHIYRNGEVFYNLRYWSYAGNNLQRLPPVLTRSMGSVRLNFIFAFPLAQVLVDPKNLSDATLVTYQIHARAYDTVPESIQFNEIERRESKGA